MHQTSFLQDLAIVMSVAALATIIFRQLKQPVVLGYILAGVIIGPHTPPFALIHDQETIATLAELGVVFLLFSLGLEFSVRKLARVGATAVVAARGIPPSSLRSHCGSGMSTGSSHSAILRGGIGRTRAAST